MGQTGVFVAANTSRDVGKQAIVDPRRLFHWRNSIQRMMDCVGQPFILLAEHTSCAESPPCTHIQCYTDIACLLAGSLSPVIAGCRVPDRDLFCICPQNEPSFASWRKKYQAMSNATTIAPTSTTQGSNLTGGAIAGIVCGVLAFVILAVAVAYFVYRYMKGRRKNHGEYRPQFEEQNHAKDLPYLQPPAVEGLI